MAQYTICTAADLQHIVDGYGLGQVISATVLKGGSQNTNYLLKTGDGKYVLTIVEQHTPEAVEKLVHLLQHLRQHDFMTSKVLANEKGSYVNSYADKPILIKKYLKGKIIEDFPPLLLERLGITLARLHQVPPPPYLPHVLDYGIEHFSQVANYAAGSDYHIWLEAQAAYLEPYLQYDLPKAFIHGDVFFNNVVVKPRKGRVVIMDFEEAVYYYRLFDIAMTIIGVCLEGEGISIEKAHHLLRGYQSQVELTSAECSALQAFVVYAATAMSFWRHRYFNYLNPTPARFEHYRALQAVADFARALPADALLPGLEISAA